MKCSNEPKDSQAAITRSSSFVSFLARRRCQRQDKFKHFSCFGLRSASVKMNDIVMCCILCAILMTLWPWFTRFIKLAVVNDCSCACEQAIERATECAHNAWMAECFSRCRRRRQVIYYRIDKRMRESVFVLKRIFHSKQNKMKGTKSQDWNFTLNWICWREVFRQRQRGANRSVENKQMAKIATRCWIIRRLYFVDNFDFVSFGSKRMIACVFVVSVSVFGNFFRRNLLLLLNLAKHRSFEPSIWDVIEWRDDIRRACNFRSRTLRGEISSRSKFPCCDLISLKVIFIFLCRSARQRPKETEKRENKMFGDEISTTAKMLSLTPRRWCLWHGCLRFKQRNWLAKLTIHLEHV